MKNINVAFASDDNYAPFLCVSLMSLLEKSTTENFYSIHILDGGISESNKNKIEQSLSKFQNKQIRYIDVDKSIFKNIKVFRQLNQSSYYRLLLPELLPHLKKVVYCDCDILILDDIANLYNIQLDNDLLGCCQVFHPNYQNVLRKIWPNEELNMVFNTGIVLMDLKKLREGVYSKKFIKFVNKNSQKLITGDQDVINIVCKGKIKLLPPYWNSSSYLFMAPNEKKCGITLDIFKRCIGNPSIVHFDGIKPWEAGSFHKYKKIFINYLRKTKYYDYKKKFNRLVFLRNTVFYVGNEVAKYLPSFLYDAIEYRYLQNNFLEQKYLEIVAYESNKTFA